MSTTRSEIILKWPHKTVEYFTFNGFTSFKLDKKLDLENILRKCVFYFI